ncbi:MAG TPA: diaminopimelate epimerase [Thiopseudomonas sp.]|nr:diaminopimelate epimerase [Thiopseudomonas sp.]
MLLRFTKMHGLGNDLMVLDLISQYAYIQPQHMRAWSDRRSGVGFRRLALIEVPQHPDVDFSCRIFDEDGAEVDWLASDVCCVARLVADKRLISKAQMRVELRHAVIDVQVHADGSVSVPLQRPECVAERIALPSCSDQQSDWREDTDFSILSMNGTHAVLRVAHVQHVPMAELVQHLELHPDLPRDTIVTALQVQDSSNLKVLAWQFGSGVVDSFHYGLCTAAVLAIEQGWVNQQVHIESICGTARAWIQSSEHDQHIYFTGSATRVYEGQIRI